MNPVRRSHLTYPRRFAHGWIYLQVPWGRLIAVGFEWILKGLPTAAGDLAARGAPGPNADVRGQM